MSQEDVEWLRAGYHYTSRTGELQREGVHPEFVWDMTTFRGAIFPGPYEGVEGANEFLAEWREGFERWSLDIEELLDAEDQVIAVVRQRGKAKGDGPEVEMRIAMVWTFRDGLAVRMEMYSSRDEALEAAGHSE